MNIKMENNSNFVLFIDWGTANFRAYKYDLRKNRVIKLKIIKEF